MQDFPIIALTLPGLTDPAVAIAATRAGGLGILDLTHTTDTQDALSAADKLVRYAKGPCGVKLDLRKGRIGRQLLTDLPEGVEVVVLAPGDCERLGRATATLHEQGRRVLLVATCLAQALAAEEAGADGIIVKGHESGGWVGEETAFILVQRVLAQVMLPVWVQGGIGLHTAAACYAGGAAGVVLDVQLALTRESPLPRSVREIIERMDGSEALCLGQELGRPFRFYARRTLAPVAALRSALAELLDEDLPPEEALAAWERTVGDRVGWGSPQECIWPVGQDAAFAEPMARRFHTVGGVLQGMRQAVDTHLQSVRALQPLAERAPLAVSHGTRYPIVQGPMARVSDTPAFAATVAGEGALPFVALSVLQGPDVDTLLSGVRVLLSDAPWGVGLLGFAPPELRKEQLEVILSHRPNFALIAGGRPDQARELEDAGIPTYLHVPSPELLKLFLHDGARRFVFEGREAGGHIGPRTSFVLWDRMIDVLLEELGEREAEACHVLFAGGIHDRRSAAMVVAMAGSLAEHGVRVGVLVGTAYLFTQEVVATGAILPHFQQEALACDGTMVLETGPGHAVRCARTPFAEACEAARCRLLRDGGTAEEVRSALEEMEIGRLRIASKGLARHPRYGQDPDVPKLVSVADEQQRTEGLYMLGQVAALRDQVSSIGALHRDIAVGGTERLASLPVPVLATHEAVADEQPSDVAIIGMACLLPRASDIRTYWENILAKVDAITEIPADRWDWRRDYDPDPTARDKVHSKWGGFLDEVPFDPTEYGIPPSALPSIDPVQLLTLNVVRAALEDSGYDRRPFDRERASVVFGASGGTGDIGQLYVARSWLPHLLEEVPDELLSELPEWTEDSFPGLLLSVIAGRVANRFDLHGTNFTVDAACASAMAAIYVAVKELETRSSDMVIVGGADLVQNPFSFLCFGKVQALSPRGRCRAFDETADGTVIGEGIGALVLKRLADAERDGDRIYAVIKAVGRSSDGRARGLTAPEPAGQVRALERAYRKAGFSPATVGLVEAHGTGTVAGDRAEVESLMRVFGAATDERQFCAIGSVKSMVGHLKATAAVAGLIKAAQALHYKVLPPTMGVDRPSSLAGFPESTFYVNTESRPWIAGRSGDGAAGDQDTPRRAGVSAFGFGGTNFHTVLEEYTGGFLEADEGAPLQHWPAELLLWAGKSRQDILSAVEALQLSLARGADPALHDLAHATWCVASDVEGDVRLAVVASSLDDLRTKLSQAQEALQDAETATTMDARGIYFTESPLAPQGQVAFLFPGQGSQYPDMLRDLAILFPEVRETFARADGALASRFPSRLSSAIFPPPGFEDDERQAQAEALTQTNVAQPALGAADMAMLHLLESLGVRPDMVAGHSYGEYAALCAAGAFDEAALYALSEARGRFIVETAGEDMGTMAAAMAGPEVVAPIVDAIDGLWMSNLNSPRQTVISGLGPAVEEAMARMREQRVRARPIPVACAFHSPLMEPAQLRLSQFLSSGRETGAIRFSPPQIQVYSNTLAAPYPVDPDAIAELLAQHLLRPVEFVRQVEAMYQAGARIFVEVGPRQVLTGLASRILEGRPCLVLATDGRGRGGEDSGVDPAPLLHALAQLAVHGVPVQLDRLYVGREIRELDLGDLVEQTRPEPLPPTTWLIGGRQPRPIHSDEANGTASSDKEDPEPAAANQASDSDRPRSSSASEASPPQPPLTDGTRGESGANPPVSPPRSHGGSGPPPTSAASDRSEVMAEFQRVMDRFLQVQQSIMLAYLQGEDGDIAPDEVNLERETGRQSEMSALQWTRALESLSVDSQEAGRPSGPPSGTQAAAATIESPTIPQVTCPVPSVPEEEGQSAVLDRARVARELLEIASERTGYPADMLDPSLDMEADLGIDSIKRVEILGALQERCLPSDRQLSQEAMEELTGIRTLGGIVSWIVETTGVREAAHEASAEEAAEDDDEPSAPRSVLIPVDAPPLESADSERGLTAKLFLVTDDGAGVAEATGEALRQRGVRVALVKAGAVDQGRVEALSDSEYAADLRDPAAVRELVNLIRDRQGPVSGVLHLLPLARGEPLEEMDLGDWQDRLSLEVKGFFYLMQAAGPDLKRSSETGGGWLMAATALGGSFGVGRGAAVGFPGQGGLAGLVKTAAAEWPQVQCRVVDFGLDASKEEVSQHLLRELILSRPGDGQPPEVGYQGTRRLMLQPTGAELDLSRPRQLSIDSDWVILVTGGARGVMAEVAQHLATRYQPTLILCGRSPLPAPAEDEDTAGLTSTQDIRQALVERMRRRGEAVTPAQVEAAASRLIKDRDMRTSLVAMQSAGARVSYHAVDVRDESAFSALIQTIYQRYGRLDGVVHGAGVIEDKLIEDKTPESFNRVFDTKADGAFILSRALQPESLCFLALFASAAGRFGNRGQSDYAAANEVMNKLGEHLDRRWPGRVVSVNWGPWVRRGDGAGAGMVSPELERQFARRGVALIPSQVGCQMLDRELAYAPKGDVEVIVSSGGEWDTSKPQAARAAKAPSLSTVRMPLLQNATQVIGSDGTLELIYTLDPARDHCLRDHRLDGHPVLPVAAGIELMAEVVARSWPDLQVVSLRDIRVLKGIVLRDGPETVRVVTRCVDSLETGQQVTVQVRIMEVETSRAYYTATVELAPQSPDPPRYERGLPGGLQSFPLSVDEVYRRYLFHGQTLQCISTIEGISDEGMVATVIPSTPQQCLVGEPLGDWILDPVVIDSGFQLGLVWARVYHDFSTLPSSFPIYRRYGPLSGPTIQCVLHSRAHPESFIMYSDLYFVGSDGRVLGSFEGAESTGSRSLNRLGGQHLRWQGAQGESEGSNQ